MADNRKKSQAKAAGVKSFLNMGDGTALITSFGKGNEAIKQKEIDVNGNVNQIIQSGEKCPFNVDQTVISHKYEINKGKTENPIEAINPVKLNNTGTVKLPGYKDAIEKRFFGNTFSDNIHIQIAYNIMDIEKILTVHINNIIYTINNIFRLDEFESEDFIGYMSMQSAYAAPFKKDDIDNQVANLKQMKSNPSLRNDPQAQMKINILANQINFSKLVGYYTVEADGKTSEKYNSRLGYFGNAFKTGGHYVPEDMFTVICILGQIRQMLAHSQGGTRSFMYNLGQKQSNPAFEKNYEKARRLLNNKYDTKVKSLNSNFVKHSEKNLTALFGVYDCRTEQEKLEIVRKYYDFIVRKENKNMGFSITSLRENIIKDYTFRGDKITDKKFDSNRGKIYRLLDFIIWNYYCENKNLTESFVSKLRASTDANAKEKLYVSEAVRLISYVRTMFDEVMYKIGNGTDIARMRVDSYLNRGDSILDGYKIGTGSDYFTKIIYLITLFIDAKEINDLVTTLINKFDNIASLESVFGNVRFIKEYELFERSEKIAKELRVLNSFARMEKPSEDAKNVMLQDAMRILGVDDSKDLSKETDFLQGAGKNRHGKRNFIINNVIESGRFTYLVRYSNTSKVSRFAKNKELVAFVINRLPDSQIDRYYSLTGSKVEKWTSKPEKVRKLTRLVNEMSYDGMISKIADNSKATADIETKKACVSFYLMVLYQITKNLVYVNSRYFMAFHCLERDIILLGVGSKLTGPDKKYNLISCVLTKETCNLENQNNSVSADESETVNHAERKKKSRSRKWYTYALPADISALDENINDSRKVRVEFRNAVEHLGVARNADLYINSIKNVGSYFDIYHHILQNLLAKKCTFISKSNNYPQLADAYSKDLLKALCAPFGYNLPKFKNLSIDALFDMNESDNNTGDIGTEEIQKPVEETAEATEESNTVTGTVTGVQPFGAFVVLDNSGQTGLIHVSRMNGYNLNKGDKVRVTIIDSFKPGKISLSIEQKI